MPNLQKANQPVQIITSTRSAHKLYEHLMRHQGCSIINLEDDLNLQRLLELLEAVLVRSGYMSELEVKRMRLGKPPSQKAQ